MITRVCIQNYSITLFLLKNCKMPIILYLILLLLFFHLIPDLLHSDMYSQTYGHLKIALVYELQNISGSNSVMLYVSL